MKALTQSIVDELNKEYALALYTDGEVVVVWRDPETGEIRKRPRGIAFRYAHHGYGRQLRCAG